MGTRSFSELLPETEVSSVRRSMTNPVTTRDSHDLKLEARIEDLKRKAQELREAREKMCEEHQRERNVLHKQNLEEVYQIRATDLKFSEKEIEHDLELIATQKEEMERRKREDSLEEYRKQFEGVQGFAKGAGRYRRLDQTATPKRTNTLRPRQKKKPC